ncbi:MAG: hypothetical protein BWY84_00956 [Candidatus Aerophobetes bacterium ADurb.Bin490]|nr:MAG: hypothetical protein BWY84_00956 [Candidatus Aerophobetes bacterium ADurb.Bin490]
METVLKFVRGGAGGALVAAGFFSAAPQSYVLWVIGAVLVISAAGACGAGSACERK